MANAPGAATEAVVAAQYTDNCSTVTATLLTSDVSGTNCGWTATYTYEIKDACGNITAPNAVVTYTGADTEPPVLSELPADVTVSCANVPLLQTITATDNCAGAVAVSLVPTTTKGSNPATSTFYNYTITRTWSATDGCSNTATHTQTITVQDILAPVITHGTIASCYHTAGDAINAVIAVTSALDNCASAGNVSRTIVLSGTDCNTIITVTYKDPSNNSSSFEYTTRIDNTPPTPPAAPAAASYACVDDVLGAETLSVEDECGGTIIGVVSETNNGGAGCQSDPLTITRIWTFTDACGNSSSVSQLITVIDNVAPVVTAPANLGIACNAPNDPTNTGTATATDNCNGTVTIAHSDVVGAIDGDHYVITRTWTATDACNNSASATQLITVTDNEGPQITSCPLSITATTEGGIDCSKTVGLEPVTVTDECGTVHLVSVKVDGNDIGATALPVNHIFPVGTSHVIYTYADNFGNENTCQFDVTVTDETDPIITSTPAAQVFCQNPGNTYVIPALAATDNCDPLHPITITYTVTGNTTVTNGTGNDASGVFNPGVSVIHWTVTDANSNTATASTTVTVNQPIVTATAGPNGSITPADATTVVCGENITYTITADDCYHIADVKVDGVSVGAVGTYTINNVIVPHTIEATFESNGSYDIVATATTGGAISPLGTSSVPCGTDATYTITADDCYSIADVLVDGVSVGAVGTYTFSDVSEAHTIHAIFTLNGPYTISASAGLNGSVTPADASTVACGDDLTYTIAADACYHIEDVLVDEVSVGPVSSYTFSDVHGNHTISATFAINGPYTITDTHVGNGSVTGSGTNVTCGTDVTYTITPDDCYHIVDVLVDGNSVGDGGSYTFNNVTDNHTIHVVFAINTYDITATAGSGGSIAPNGVTPVDCHASQAYTITADANYHILDVTVDGNSEGAIGTYTFTDVTATHTIHATFEANTFTINASSGGNGTISPDGETVVALNGSQAYTITPAPCYHIDEVTIDGVPSGPLSSHTFTNVTANHTISVTFALNAVIPAIITPSGSTSFCTGESVTLTASAGDTWLWSNGETTQSIIVNGSGTYSVTITTDGCPSSSAPTETTVNPLPIATISADGPTTFCEGGSVTLTASAGASWIWSNGEETQSIIVTTGGSYTVTVTNAEGCSATSSPTVVTVNNNPAAIITPDGPTTFCPGGSVNLTASAGTSWLWSNGATTQSINVTADGTFSVTVTNAEGCSATSSPTVVTVNSNPTATIDADGPTTFCTGGSVTLTASSGASWLWSNGATTQSITVSTGGSYSVTVTNGPGCSATSSPTVVTVNSLPLATITPSGPTTFCTGGSVTLTASAGASWLWSNGATTQAITVTAGDSYSVTVTNAEGCSATSAPTVVTVNSLPTATISAGGPTTFCSGGSVTLTASAGASWLWSNGATTQAITVTTGGSYSVTVTNAEGCSATSAPTAVTVNPLPTATITPSGPTTFCTGGSVTLTASAGASWLWSNGATTQAITVNANGSFSVTVTSAEGCSATSAPTVVTVGSATATISAGGPTTFCSGGSVVLTASAGSSWLWSNGATTQAITVTTSGSYSVTVTVGSCSGTSAPTVVTVNPLPTATISAGGPTTFCTGGSVVLTASAGTSWLWSNGATTQAITVNTGGSYSVTVTSAAGCSATSAPTVVTVNPNVSAGIVSGTTPLCIGQTATYTTTGTGGSWSSTNPAVASVNATSGLVTALTAGTTNITYTVSSGCGSPVSAAKLLTVSPNVSAGIVSGTTPLCIGQTATYTTTGTGGSWSSTNPAVASVNATSGLVTALTAGTTNITYTVSSGCGSPVSAAKLLTVSPNVSAGVVSGTSPLCVGATATYTTTGAGGTWSSSNPAVASVNATSGLVTALTAGTTNITYTVSSGCGSPVSAIKALTVSASPTPGTVNGTTPLCIGATATYTKTGTTGGTWTSTNTAVATVNASTGLVTALTAGTTNITYTVTNCSGTPVSAFKTLTVSPNVSAGVVSGTSPLCVGATATYTTTGTGGSWSSSNPAVASVNATSGLVTALTVGTTNITYTVSSGCGSPASAIKALTVAASPTPGTVNGTTPLCIGATATYTKTGTTGGTWTSTNTAVATVNASTGLVTALTAGTTNITYTVTNCSGTPVSAFKTLTVSPNVNPGTVNGTSPLCVGATATYTKTGATGGTWSSTNTAVASVNATSGLVTALSAGTTNITYTLTTGCGAPIAAFKTLTVTTAPTPGTVNGTTPLCIGATATYTKTGTAGGTWTSTNTAVASVNASTGLVTALTAGTTNITYTVTNCSGTPVSAFKTLTVSPNVNPGTVNGTSPLCVGATATYTKTGATGGTWSSTNTAVASVNATSGLVTALSAGTTNITYTLTTGCGAPIAAFKTLTVTTAPTPGTVNGTTPLCIGATATYTKTGTAGGTWTSTNTAVASVNASTGLVTALTAGTTNITYTVTNCSGTPISAFKTLTVSPNVSPGTVNGTSPLCVGATATYTKTGAAGGTWTSTNTAVASVNATSGLVTALSAGTTNITYTLTTGCGAPVSAFKTLTVNAAPTVAAIGGGAATVCTGGTTPAFTDATPGGTWSIANGTGSATIAPTGVVTGVSAGTVTVRYTVTSCGSTTVTRALTVVAGPRFTTIAYNGTPYCRTSLVAQVTRGGTSGGQSGGTYSYTNSSGQQSGLFFSTSSGLIVPWLSSNGTYTVRYTYGSGTCTAVATTTVTIMTCSGARLTQRRTETDPHMQGFNAKIEVSTYPNPSENFFNLKVKTVRSEPVVIKVFEMSGKLVQTIKGAPYETFRFGDHLVTGMYFVEVWQGSEKVMSKVVKQ